MGTDKFDTSLASGIHHQLSLITGEWEGTTKTWFEADKVEDESSIKGTMRSILGGRFILHEYESFFKGSPTSGLAIIGYSISSGTYQCAWVDSFHMGTGILFSEAKAEEKLFSVLGSYGGPDIPEPWGWKTEIDLISNDNMIITAYNISPEGESVKATETLYNRK